MPLIEEQVQHMSHIELGWLRVDLNLPSKLLVPFKQHQAPRITKPRNSLELRGFVIVYWLRGVDLNLRPSDYEPDELPGCSTPLQGGSVCVYKGLDPLRSQFS